uniref:Uncharacterized protein n=1 Tax=Glossina austeni TaxID=7395 RepID=A0A1A9UCZ0_GLOAU
MLSAYQFIKIHAPSRTTQLVNIENVFCEPIFAFTALLIGYEMLRIQQARVRALKANTNEALNAIALTKTIFPWTNGNEYVIYVSRERLRTLIRSPWKDKVKNDCDDNIDSLDNCQAQML